MHVWARRHHFFLSDVACSAFDRSLRTDTARLTGIDLSSKGWLRYLECRAEHHPATDLRPRHEKRAARAAPLRETEL